jgi:hypothetical protein
MYGSMQASSSFAKAIGMQCVFSFGNRSVPNAKIVALSEINLAFGLKNGPARARRISAWLALMARAQFAAAAAQNMFLVGFQQDSLRVALCWQ